MEEKSIKGTRTEQNLLTAFASECQDRGRYTIYADKADGEGLHHIAAVFRQTADQEQSHARQFFSLLDGGNIEITASFPSGPIGDTCFNLKEAAAAEHAEWELTYEAFAQTAQEEAFPRIANLFRLVAGVEKMHEARFIQLLERLNGGTQFEEAKPVEWSCHRCGFTIMARQAPKRCPICGADQGWFKRRTE